MNWNLTLKDSSASGTNNIKLFCLNYLVLELLNDPYLQVCNIKTWSRAPDKFTCNLWRNQLRSKTFYSIRPCTSLSVTMLGFERSTSMPSFDLSILLSTSTAPTSSRPSTKAGAVAVKSVYVPWSFRFRFRLRSSLYLFHSATSGAL